MFEVQKEKVKEIEEIKKVFVNNKIMIVKMNSSLDDST